MIHIGRSFLRGNAAHTCRVASKKRTAYVGGLIVLSLLFYVPNIGAAEESCRLDDLREFEKGLQALLERAQRGQDSSAQQIAETLKGKMTDFRLGDSIEVLSISKNKYTGRMKAEDADKIFLEDGRILQKSRILRAYRIGAGDPRLVGTGTDYQALVEVNRRQFHSMPSRRASDFYQKDAKVPGGAIRQVRYSLADRNYAVRTGRILEGITPQQLKPGRYTYVVTEDGGMAYGVVNDGMEYGVKHFHLANDRAVVLAGEIHVNGNGKILYNLTSGTYTKKLIERGGDPNLLRQKAQNIFGEQGIFTESDLLSKEPPSQDSFNALCASPEFQALNIGLCH